MSSLINKKGQYEIQQFPKNRPLERDDRIRLCQGRWSMRTLLRDGMFGDNYSCP